MSPPQLYSHIHVLCNWRVKFLFDLCRFKDHVQNNNPKHFLSEEEFVQLRLELSKANLVAMVCEDEETPVAQEELPPGTEDLADPAKVQIQLPILQGRICYILIAFRS